MVPRKNILQWQDSGSLYFGIPHSSQTIWFGVTCFGNLEKTAGRVFIWTDFVFPLGCTAASHLLPAWAMGRFFFFFPPFPSCGSYNRNNHFFKWKGTHSLFIISATDLLLILYASFCSLKDNLEIWVINPRLIGGRLSKAGNFAVVESTAVKH